MPRSSKSNENEIKEQSITGRLSILLKDSVIYGALLALSKFSILLILPITTRYLSTGGYGALDTIMLAGTLVTIIMIVCQDEALGRFYYDKSDESSRKALLTASFLITAAGCLACAVIIYIFSPEIVTALFGDSEYLREFRLILIYAPITVLLNFSRSVMRWTFRKKAFFILSAGPTALILILTYLFVIIFKWDVAGAIYAQIISNGLFIIAALFLSRSLFTVKINKEVFSPLLKYGAPLMVMVACTNLIPVADKGMYTYFFGSDTLGIYSFASRYAMFISLPLTAFVIAWGPMLFTTYNENNANQTIQNVILTYAALFSAALYIQIVLAGPVTTLIASEKYISSIYFVAPLSLSMILDTFSSITAAGTDISKKTYLHTAATIVGLALMFATVYPLVKLFGPIGVAYCTLLGRLLSHILRTAASYRAHPFRYRLAGSYMALLLAFVLSLLCQHLPVYNPPVSIFLRVVFFIPLAGYIWLILLPDEVRSTLFNKFKKGKIL